MPRLIASLFTAIAILLFGVQITQAQGQGRTILVLDASGSMWGQIEGKAKITIAQEVMGSLLATIPDDQALGLTVYGHRRKGDCNDIETLVRPGTASRDAILGAVNAIKPKGKTPLSAAVVAAANELKYTEEKATVILVSDGKETCDFDPCEVGRALEAAGVDFTAHVIGFDVANPADRAQLQCLAENTGGTFKTASNAAELTEALKVVAEPAPPPPPKPGRVRFVAIEGSDGPRILEGLRWSLTNLDSGAVLSDMQSAAGLDEMLLPGRYLVEVLRSDNETSAEMEVGVSQNTDTTFTLVLPLLIPAATISGPDTGIAGDSVMVEWTGPDGEGDYIAISEPGEKGIQWVMYTYSREGSPLSLQMPSKPGTYELRYIHAARRMALAQQVIEVLPVTATLDLPAQALAGETVSVGWTGPDYQSDYLATALPGDGNTAHITYSYTRDGSPLGLVMPSEPGSYEVRYVMNQDATVIASKPIEVVAVSATLSAADTAAAGASLAVEWTGPGYDRDYLSVARVGDNASSYVNYTYTRHGSPAELLMPAEPGDYEIRYVMNQDSVVLATRPIRIEAVTASLGAPATADAGSTITLEWSGPDYQNDYISVAMAGDKGGKYEHYVYTRHGSPARLQMPAKAGQYEIRYVQHQGQVILAQAPISVTAISASLSAPEAAEAGSTVQVDWSGPDYQNDYISVARIGDKGNAYANYVYTRHGSPARLLMPAEAGEYEIRYVQNQDRKILASQKVMISAVSASLSHAPTAAVGEPFLIEWSGPDYQNDYIAVARLGDKPGAYIQYVRTREGSPVRLAMPMEPGSYEIRYVQNQDRKILATSPVEVEAVSASVTTAATGKIGESLLVEWTGPDYRNDYIAVALPGDKDTKYLHYTRTSDGSPLRLQMPGEPGQYEIRYVAKGNPPTKLASTMITLEPVEASVMGPTSGTPGAEIVVEWSGPDYPRDYIAIGLKGDKRRLAYKLTREGSPLRLRLPDRPGLYELRYILNSETVVARQDIEVK